MATLAERAAAAQARLAPKAEQHDANASSSAPVKLSKALQAEADYEGPVERVELDGLAVLKILQHASESTISTNAAGFLFGLSLGSRLSISNSFPLPANHLLPGHITTIANVNSSAVNSSDEKIKAAKVVSEREREVDNAFKNAKTFIGNYAPRAKELNLDSEVAGGYFVAKDGMDLLKEGVLVDILVRLHFGSGSGTGASSQPLAAIGGAAAGQTAKYRASSRTGRRSIAVVYGKSNCSGAGANLAQVRAVIQMPRRSRLRRWGSKRTVFRRASYPSLNLADNDSTTRLSLRQGFHRQTCLFLSQSASPLLPS